MLRKTYALRLLVLIGSASLVAACETSRVFLPADGCSTLAEGILGRVTPHAVLGDSGDADLDWKLYGAAETGQVNSANLDKKDGLAIIQRCEKRDASAAAKINAPAWQFWR